MFGQPLRRKIFISYHHENDQHICDTISSVFHDKLELLFDRSLDEPINSRNPQYIERKIREDYIYGSSVTIVLCGSETPKRKHVDWEINSTLNYKHGLLGLLLPTAKLSNGKFKVPARLHDNVVSGYAHTLELTADFYRNPSLFISAIEEAYQRSTKVSKIQNGREKMSRDL